MFTFLLIVQTIVAVALCTVILLQRSEGGGLGVGGSSSGFMTARGAADFLSRSTAWLGGAFIVLCIALAAIAGTRNDGLSVDAAIANAPVSQAPVQQAPAPAPAPADNGAVPLAQ
nr:preprotein translocase subunit SecG [uncultured Sphingomonas sp.]